MQSAFYSEPIAKNIRSAQSKICALTFFSTYIIIA
jgi:hypothetical protein